MKNFNKILILFLLIFSASKLEAGGEDKRKTVTCGGGVADFNGKRLKWDPYKLKVLPSNFNQSDVNRICDEYQLSHPEKVKFSKTTEAPRKPYNTSDGGGKLPKGEPKGKTKRQDITGAQAEEMTADDMADFGAIITENESARVKAETPIPKYIKCSGSVIKVKSGDRYKGVPEGWYKIEPFVTIVSLARKVIEKNQKDRILDDSKAACVKGIIDQQLIPLSDGDHKQTAACPAFSTRKGILICGKPLKGDMLFDKDDFHDKITEIANRDTDSITTTSTPVTEAKPKPKPLPRSPRRTTTEAPRPRAVTPKPPASTPKVKSRSVLLRTREAPRPKPKEKGKVTESEEKSSPSTTTRAVAAKGEGKAQPKPEEKSKPKIKITPRPQPKIADDVEEIELDTSRYDVSAPVKGEKATPCKSKNYDKKYKCYKKNIINWHQRVFGIYKKRLDDSSKKLKTLAEKISTYEKKCSSQVDEDKEFKKQNCKGLKLKNIRQIKDKELVKAIVAHRNEKNRNKKLEKKFKSRLKSYNANVDFFMKFFKKGLSKEKGELKKCIDSFNIAPILPAKECELSKTDVIHCLYTYSDKQKISTKSVYGFDEDSDLFMSFVTDVESDDTPKSCKKYEQDAVTQLSRLSQDVQAIGRDFLDLFQPAESSSTQQGGKAAATK